MYMWVSTGLHVACPTLQDDGMAVGGVTAGGQRKPGCTHHSVHNGAQWQHKGRKGQQSV